MTIYVDSNATGANDGTSFADAYTSIDVAEIDTSTLEDETILIASDHSESIGAFDVGGSGSDDWIRIISVNSSTEVYEPGASITSTGVMGFGFCHVQGVTLSTTQSIDTVNSREPSIFENCDITCTEFRSFSTFGYLELINTVFTSTSTSAPFSVAGMRMFGGSVTAANLGSSDGIVFGLTISASYFAFFGVDFTGIPTDARIHRSFSSAGSLEVIRFVNCLFPSGWVNEVVRPGAFAPYELTLVGCGADGDTVNPAINYHYEQFGGYVETDTAVSRDGGASDGTTDFSWQVTCIEDNAASRSRMVRSGSEGITFFVAPGDTNVRIHLAHDAVGAGTSGRLTDAEVWATYVGPSEAATATHQGRFDDGDRSRFGETAADLTDDTETWTGSGVGTKQRIDIPIDPTVEGAASVIVHFALSTSSSVVVHLCPKIEVT